MTHAHMKKLAVQAAPIPNGQLGTFGLALKEALGKAETAMLSQKLTLAFIQGTVNSKLCMGFGDCHVSFVETDIHDGHFSVFFPKTAKLGPAEKEARREEALMRFKFEVIEALQDADISLAHFIGSHLNHLGEGIFNQKLKLSEDGATVSIGTGKFFVEYTSNGDDSHSGNFKVLADRPKRDVAFGDQAMRDIRYALVFRVLELGRSDPAFKEFVSRNYNSFYDD